MRLTKPILANALTIMIVWLVCVPNCVGQGLKPPVTDTRQQQTLQLCREALLNLTHCQETEALYKKQAEELKAANSNLEEQVRLKDSAILKYEAAITARTAAESLVSELRSNYERQIALAEKQLAIEQQKASFWRSAVRIGMVAAFMMGAAAAYAITK